VPIQKYSKLDRKIFQIKELTPVRAYSTIPNNQLKYINYEKIYENIFDMKKDILNDNKGKSGIYM